MQLDSSLKVPNSYVHDGPVKCPLCQSELIRQRRRPVDRLLSLVQPVKRYRCENFSCQWFGNVATTRSDATAADNAHVRRVPVAFVVHMVLVAVGVLFVLVYSTLEPTPRADGTTTIFGSNVHGWTAEWLAARAKAG